jgi:deazaflavin-dependent oxidoreductase (nitroreductase family)
MPYPRGLLRAVLKSPLLLYRLGLGDILNLFNIMILGVCGRKSGQPRYAPVEYRRHGSKWYVVSGWGERPQWYHNLLAHPSATMQIGSRAYAARAQVVTDPAEALRVLTLFRRHATGVYDATLARLSSGGTLDPKALPDISAQFTIIRLEMLEDGRLSVPPLPRDLAVVWAGVLATGLTLMALRMMRQHTDTEG